MADEYMRKLKRPELLRMLLDSVRENERLELELASTRSLLESRELSIADAGSLAEATLKLNGVFESAQAAADQYLVNVQQQYEGREEMVRQAQAKAEEQAAAVKAAAAVEPYICARTRRFFRAASSPCPWERAERVRAHRSIRAPTALLPPSPEADFPSKPLAA